LPTLGKPVSGLFLPTLGKPVSGLFLPTLGKPVSGLFLPTLGKPVSGFFCQHSASRCWADPHRFAASGAVGCFATASPKRHPREGGDPAKYQEAAIGCLSSTQLPAEERRCICSPIRQASRHLEA